jgi:RNA polymerase sigma factor (sigma-70 family)
MTVLSENRALLEGFRRGERDALTEVYRAYVDDVARLVRRGFVVEAHGHWHVRGVADVDEEHELVQETFARAFADRARASYDGLRPYRPFLLRIAKNLLIDRARRLRRDAQLGPLDEATLDGAALAEPSEADDPEDRARAAEWSGLAESARGFVAGLDDESRRFVELRFTEGLSQAETAARLEVTRRRVRTLETRVLRALGRHLRRQGGASR